MSKLIHNIAFILAFGLTTLTAHALDAQLLPDINANAVSMQIQEPARSVGYTVGDVITRHVILKVKKPYKLIDESLPIVGYQKRYKGQLLGIDLSGIKHTSKDNGTVVTHELDLSYQVFTNKTVAKRSAIPTEYVNIINVDSKGKEIGKFRIPSFELVISPIAAFGQVKIEEDMSKFRGPLLLNRAPLAMRLKILLSLFGLSLLALLYMLGKHTWLPRMGGPFAKAYRAIRKAPNTPQGLQQAVSSMHQSLNSTAGVSLFSGNLEQFLVQKPAYKTIKTEFEQFFALSRQVFFEPNSKHNVGENPLQWLVQFCKRCRDCERGLIPDSKA